MKVFSNKDFTNLLSQYPNLGKNIDFFSLYGYHTKITHLTFLCLINFLKKKVWYSIYFFKNWQFLTQKKSYLANILSFHLCASIFSSVCVNFNHFISS